MARDPQKLDVFQLADAVVLEVYECTKPFPKEERYGLTTQLRATQTQHEWHGVAVADRLGDVLAQRSHAPSGRGVVSDKEVDLVRMGPVELVTIAARALMRSLLML